MRNKSIYIIALAALLCSAILLCAFAPVRRISTEAEAKAETHTTETTHIIDVDTEAAAEKPTEARSVERQPKVIIVNATAYCSCVKCCGKSDGITATGTKATAGRTIAVDPAVIPYGTEVVINGHTYVAEDCGGAINGNDIDIYFESHDAALQFGRQTLTAYIYE